MAHSLNRFVAYFDLQSDRRGKPEAYAAGTNLRVFPQYISLVLGITVQPLFARFQVTGSWVLDYKTFINWTIFAILTGLVVFPTVYRRAFDPDQPKFVQFCTIFASGIGWKSLFTAVLKNFI